MILSYIKIEILALHYELVTLGHNGSIGLENTPSTIFVLMYLGELQQLSAIEVSCEKRDQFETLPFEDATDFVEAKLTNIAEWTNASTRLLSSFSGDSLRNLVHQTMNGPLQKMLAWQFSL